MLKTEIEIDKTLNKCFHGKVKEDDENHCVRGLEELVKDQPGTTFEHIVKHREVILNEVDNMLKDKESEELDWQKLRDISKQYSRSSEKTALALAQSDEEFVQEQVLPCLEDPSELLNNATTKKRPNIFKKLFRFLFRKN
jgi:hypothetical protein